MDYQQHAIKLFDFQLLHLELNSFLFMAVLSLVVMLLLNWLLFRPVLRTLDARAALMERLQSDVESRRKELEQLTQSYRQELAQVRAQVEQVRHQARVDAQRMIEGVLQQARHSADATLTQALEELKRDTERAKTELARSASGLAERAVQRILN